MDARCLCLTEENEQCTRNVSLKEGDDHRFCWQHQGCTKVLGEIPQELTLHVSPQKHEIDVPQKRPLVKGEGKLEQKVQMPEKPQRITKIKLSDIATTNYCGMDACVKSQLIIPNIDNYDITFINLVRCLRENLINENIMGIQLSILFNLTKTLSENEQLQDQQKKLLINNLLKEYCTAYQYWIYTHYYHNVLKLSKYTEDLNLVRTSFWDLDLSKTCLLYTSDAADE